MTENPNQTEMIKRLRPVHTGLRPDLEVSRHLFHGEVFYVVRDPVTFLSYNVSAANYQILTQLHDSVTLGTIFDKLTTEGLVAPDQEEDFFRFILTLQQRGFLQLPISDGKSLFNRYRLRQQSKHREKVMSILFAKVPLINPDSFLARTTQYVRPLFTQTAFVIWLICMTAGGFVLMNRWDSFVAPIEDVLAAKNLFLLVILLIGLKVIHEFGHAYACKLFGGKVPEMGVFFMLLTPCAYVDASATWGFPSRKQRIIVSLAGMYFESMVALIGLLIWSMTSPSFIHSCGHQIVLLAGVMTCAMNLNPLMRYDGYYVLSDLLNIPNLRTRSYEQVQKFSKRLFLGVRQTPSTLSRNKSLQLFIYGVLAVQYKVVLVLAISAMIAMKLQIPGLIASGLYLFHVVAGTLGKLATYLWYSPETAPVRIRAVALSLIVLVGIPVGVMAVPLSQSRYLPGLIVSENESPVFAGASGFMQPIGISPGTKVERNEVLCRLENPDVHSLVANAESELRHLELQSRIVNKDSGLETAQMEQRINYVREVWNKAKQDHDRLTIRSPKAATVLAIERPRQHGHFVHKGEQVCTLVSGKWVVRTLATAEDIADMQASVGQNVRIRILADLSRDLRGTISSIAPLGNKRIQWNSLTHLGGGDIPVSSRTNEAEQPYFELTVHFSNDPELLLQHGMNAQICCDSIHETYSQRLVRQYRRFVNRLLVL